MLKKIRKMLQRQEGFTLVELMIVVVILGVLAGVGVQQYGQVQERARDSVHQANERMIESAVRMYHIATGNVPQSMDNLKGYGLDEAPESPWNDDRVYGFTVIEETVGEEPEQQRTGNIAVTVTLSNPV